MTVTLSRVLLGVAARSVFTVARSVFTVVSVLVDFFGLLPLDLLRLRLLLLLVLLLVTLLLLVLDLLLLPDRDGDFNCCKNNNTSWQGSKDWTEIPYLSYVFGVIGLSKGCRPRSDRSSRSSLIRVLTVCYIHVYHLYLYDEIP